MGAGNSTNPKGTSDDPNDSSIDDDMMNLSGAISTKLDQGTKGPGAKPTNRENNSSDNNDEDTKKGQNAGPPAMPRGYSTLRQYTHTDWFYKKGDVLKLLHAVRQHLTPDYIVNMQSTVLATTTPIVTSFRTDVGAIMIKYWPEENESLVLADVGEVMRLSAPEVAVCAKRMLVQLLQTIIHHELLALASLFETLKGHEGNALSTSESKKAQLRLMTELAVDDMIVKGLEDIEYDMNATVHNSYGVSFFLARTIEIVAAQLDMGSKEVRIPRTEYLASAKGWIETSLNPLRTEVLAPYGGVLLYILCDHVDVGGAFGTTVSMMSTVHGSTSSASVQAECQAHDIMLHIAAAMRGTPTESKGITYTTLDMVTATLHLKRDLSYKFSYRIKGTSEVHVELGFYCRVCISGEDMYVLAARTMDGVFSKDVWDMKMDITGAMKLRDFSLYPKMT